MSSIFRPSDDTSTSGITKTYLDSLQLASKSYVNSAIESIDISGDSEAYPFTLAERDENGDCAFNGVTCNSILISDGAANSKVLLSDDDGNGTWHNLGSAAWSNYASAATPDTLVMRDSTGSATFSAVTINAPSASGHAANKLYVDNQVTAITTNATSAATANTLVKRDGSGNATFSAVTVNTTPTASNHATNKSYVDTQIASISGAQYKGEWIWSTTYQTGNLVSQPVQIATVSKLYGNLLTPQTITNVGTIYNGVGVEFEGYGVVTGVQFYVPAGTRPDSGYTVYFHSAPGLYSQSSCLKRISSMAGMW